VSIPPGPVAERSGPVGRSGSAARLGPLLAAVREGFRPDEAMAVIAELSALDRYQASRGIEVAADRVAELAERAGLAGVEVVRHPADGERRWWTFRAPRSWTPVAAALDLPTSGVRVTEYPAQACSLATYSAPTPSGGVEAPVVVFEPGLPDEVLRGAVVALPAPLPVPFSEAAERAETAGAAGFVSDLASGEIEGREAVGRIELSPGARLFGFSVTPGRMAEVVAAGRVRAVVEVEAVGEMPLVTGVLPGPGPTGPGVAAGSAGSGSGGSAGGVAGEVVLLAHLCHPRPGANDNLSGVAALLGVAGALASLGGRAGRGLPGITPGSASPERRLGIRFLWGPEFVATAAYLHGVEAGRWPRPAAAIDLDMVGEDLGRCGGPLVLERSPSHLRSPGGAVAERCLELLSASEGPGWRWRAAPFAGASDHLLFADRSVGVPAVQLGHWPDRFRHTSADTLENVDPAELGRVVAVAGATAATLAALPSSAAAGGPDPGGSDPEDPDPDDPLGEEPGPVLRRRWPGPFNLRALVEDSGPDRRRWLWRRLDLGRDGYAELVALARAIDDASGRDRIARRASRSSGLGIEPAVAGAFLDAMLEAGWAEER
jgi:Peptidase family M28